MLPQDKLKTSATVDDDEEVEVIKVDDDEEIEVEDATGDVNVAAKLPPHGIYPVKIKNPKKDDSVYKAKTKSEPYRAFVGINGLAVEIQDENWEGAMAFQNHINSLQRRGKATSDLHHLLNVAGSPASNKTNVGQLLAHTREVLESEPVVYAEIDWRASYKNGKNEYIDLKTTMEGFPKHYVNSDGETVSSAKEGKWDGTYVQEIPHPETAEPVQAQLWVRKFLTQAEAGKLLSKARSI